VAERAIFFGGAGLGLDLGWIRKNHLIMLKVDFKTKRVFGFTPPNLCLLGNENDFHELAQAIVVLTGQNDVEINLLDLPFVSRAGEDKTIIFSSKEGSKLLGCFDDKNQLVFALDKRYWDRLFVFFVLES
jgi:hypothetical protein